MNIFNIKRSFKQKKERGWDKLWWFIDLHDTICKGDYLLNGGEITFYKGAKKVLQLSSCSHKDNLNKVLGWFNQNNITFNHVNENPDIGNNKLSDFSEKPYFNVFLDDKAGFEGETDWDLVEQELINEFGHIIYNGI